MSQSDLDPPFLQLLREAADHHARAAILLRLPDSVLMAQLHAAALVSPYGPATALWRYPGRQS